ncbi:MAG: LysR family transcriptional regulator [Lachnospiraceae bacterium]|nr:LysR family transcriptional regulator [Lachnospiraceae bacterium]MCM1230804.1 LysR family transcriptional regulator [Ruminococcus flavefaciens]
MIMLNNNMHIFITVAQTVSLTETAKKLYISQPAVSQAIKKLEDELNVKLFIRNKRSRLILTAVGKEILVLANQMYDLENRLYQTAYEENHMMGGIVRVASVPLATALILSRVLPVFKKQFPDVNIELFESNPLGVKNMVLDYKVDLGISTSPYMGLEHKHLMTDRIVSIDRDRSVKLNLSEDTSNLILCRVAYESICEQLKGRNFDFTHSMIVEAASTQINMVANGNGTGAISGLMLSTILNELVIGEVTPAMEMEISLITHDFNELSTAAKCISDMILERTVI